MQNKKIIIVCMIMGFLFGLIFGYVWGSYSILNWGFEKVVEIGNVKMDLHDYVKSRCLSNPDWCWSEG